MANVLPILRNTTGTLNGQVLYPFIRTVSCSTTVHKFQNATEQRWVNRNPLFNFSLPMTSLNVTDKAAWLAFFVTTKGRLASDLQLSLGSTTYSNLSSESDDLAVTNKIPLFFDQQINLLQVSNYPWTIPAVSISAFPLLRFGSPMSPVASFEMPFTQNSSFFTDNTTSPYGQQYSYGWYGTGLSGFPTSYLRAWKLSYPLLTDADALTLEQFFEACQGQYSSFDFTDPFDSITHHKVRFASDNLSFKYGTLNQQAADIVLVQTN